MTNQFTELETITDEELLAASGGGVGKTLGSFAKKGLDLIKKHPDKVVNGLSAAHEALTSNGELQNLEVV